MDIIFTDVTGANLEKPKPASSYIPDWYKDMESYVGGSKKPIHGTTGGTIKKCIPVFDAITSGYIIESPADIYVSLVQGEQMFQYSDFGPLNFHSVDQAPTHPNRTPFSYPKWNNPWSIKTPKGYSTLFIQPLHRESVFTVFAGVVDTDQYTAPVNFPFVINQMTYEGLIPKGTPIVQAIPFRRDSWNSVLGSKKDLDEQSKVFRKIQSKFFDSYKTMFWSKKEYK